MVLGGRSDDALDGVVMVRPQLFLVTDIGLECQESDFSDRVLSIYSASVFQGKTSSDSVHDFTTCYKAMTVIA